MKKHLLQGRAITAALVLSLSLAACGGDDDDSSAQPDKPEVPEQPGTPGTPEEPGNPQLRCAP